MSRWTVLFTVVIFTMLMVIGCSGGGSPTSPSENQDGSGLEATPLAQSDNDNTYALGYYDIHVDPVSETIEIVKNRTAAYTINVIPFLNEMTSPENGIDFGTIVFDDSNPDNLKVDVEVQFHHPFPSLIQYQVYDFLGVIVTNGDSNLSYNSLNHSEYGSNTFMTNADCYTEWMNPTEFPTGLIFGWAPGGFQTGKYNAKLNPAKYYASGLSSTGDVWEFLESGSNNNGLFQSGMARMMSLEFPSAPAGDGFTFGYLALCCWEVQCEKPYPPYHRDEVIACKVDVTDSIYYTDSEQGGNLTLDIGLWSWDEQPAVVKVESTVFTNTMEVTDPPTAGGDNYMNYSFDVPITATLTGTEGHEFWVIAESSAYDYKQIEGIPASDGPLAAFFRYDLYVADSSYHIPGELEWAVKAGGTGFDGGEDITTLSDNSTVATGYFVETTIFGEGEPNETQFDSVGERDMYIARYNTDGTLDWVKSVGSPGPDIGEAVTTLSDDSTVVSGIFSDTVTFGEGEPNETELVSVDQGDVFIARYHSDGTLEWAKSAGGLHTECGQGITALSDNSTVVIGTFYSTVTFGAGEPNETDLISSGGNRAFIARYHPDGTLAWAVKPSGTSSVFGFGITSLSDNSTVAVGYFTSTVTFGAGEPNETILTSGTFQMFIARYNPDGTLVWAKQASGTGSSFGFDVTTLSDNSIVTTGYIYYDATYGAGEPNETQILASGITCSTIARYNPDGTLAWVKGSGGTGGAMGHGVTTLSDDSVVTTGMMTDTVIFGSGEPNEIQLSSSSQGDFLIARYNADGTLVWAKNAGGDEYDVANGITSLSDNSTVVTGEFMSTATFGSSEPNETQLISSGDRDIFIARHWP